jgi:hypothetical protein
VHRDPISFDPESHEEISISPNINHDVTTVNGEGDDPLNIDGFDDSDGEAEEGREAVKPKVIHRGLADPLPTPEEREQHMIAHEPFRSWCAHCVRGKCVAGPHRNKAREPGALSTLHCDYCFLVKQRAGENEDVYDARRGSPIMVAYDSQSRSLMAHYVVRKGVHPYSIRVLKTFIKKLGYSRMLYRTDQENAITSIMEEVGRQAKSQMVREESKAYDSQSNGVVEAAVQSFEESFRTARDALESRLGKRLIDDHPEFG